MAEDLPPDPETKSLEERAAERAREMHVENLALAMGSKDPGFMDALTKRKAVEVEADNSARRRAAEHIYKMRERNQGAEFSQHPWGLDYLELDTSPQAIHDRVSGQMEQEKNEDKELESQRKEELEQAMLDARKLTIELGQIVARKLKQHGVTPDTVVGIEHVKEVKKITREGLRLEGKLRTKVPEVQLEEEGDGSPHAWKLPISGQIDDLATVVLNEDGVILTAYGKFEKGTDEEPSRLSIKPNKPLRKEKPGRLPIISKPEPATLPRNTYVSRVDARLTSDLGMANLPVNTPVAKAHMVLSREQAMQEAIVSLLVVNDIPLTGSEATTRTMPADTELATEARTEISSDDMFGVDDLSDEEKDYLNSGVKYRDPRLTKQRIDTLKGEARLLGHADSIEIVDYIMSQKTKDELKHYFMYIDKKGEEKYTTLDQFVWSLMPAERREKLRQAGLDPDDLETDKHPILKPYW